MPFATHRDAGAGKIQLLDLNKRIHLNRQETWHNRLQAKDAQVCSEQRGLRACLGLAHQTQRQTPPNREEHHKTDSDKNHQIISTSSAYDYTVANDAYLTVG